MRIPSARLVLRDFRGPDLDDVAALVGDERVTSWLSFDNRTRDEAEQMLDGVLERQQQDPRTEYYLAICRHGDDTVIGFARLGLDGVKAAKLGYAIHPDHQAHGYATEACAALVGYGFAELGLHRISAAIGPDNKPSIAVVGRLGMTYEGRIRDHVHTNGTWRDSLLYSILEHEGERLAVNCRKPQSSGQFRRNE